MTGIGHITEKKRNLPAERNETDHEKFMSNNPDIADTKKPNPSNTENTGIAADHESRKYSLAAFLNSVKKRLPGGFLLRNLDPRNYSFRYGAKVSLQRMLYHLGVYFISGRIVKKKPLSALRPPYPILYHFSPEINRDSITEKGLLPNQGVVWLTDWKESHWLDRMVHYKMDNKLICFRVDTERLASSGHKIRSMNYIHEFVTDCVSPDCLQLTDSIEDGRHNDLRSDAVSPY